MNNFYSNIFPSTPEFARIYVQMMLFDQVWGWMSQYKKYLVAFV
jgi:hypothetical protein